MNTLPEVVTHNYDPEGVFLQNLCDLPLAEAEQVLQRIRDAGKRTIKANYLGRRLETEAWLINERQRLLGQTRRGKLSPFISGRLEFADERSDAARPYGHRTIQQRGEVF